MTKLEVDGWSEPNSTRASFFLFRKLMLFTKFPRHS